MMQRPGTVSCIGDVHTQWLTDPFGFSLHIHMHTKSLTHLCSLNTQTDTHTSTPEFLIAFLQFECIISFEINLGVTQYASTVDIKSLCEIRGYKKLSEKQFWKNKKVTTAWLPGCISVHSL